MSEPWRKKVVLGNAELYLGDCLEILPSLPKVDAVITDPPYGIAHKWSGGSERHGWTKANQEGLLRNQWDVAPPSADTLQSIIGKAPVSILWGGNYFDLPPSRCWLVWNKPERGFSLAEAELAWTNKDAVVRVFDGPRSDADRQHPTQKPLQLMTWCMRQAGNPQAVLDPFMGSGTTGVAALKAGSKFIGIEIEPKYFDVACERIENAQRQERMFA